MRIFNARNFDTLRSLVVKKSHTIHLQILLNLVELEKFEQSDVVIDQLRIRRVSYLDRSLKVIPTQSGLINQTNEVKDIFSKWRSPNSLRTLRKSILEMFLGYLESLINHIWSKFCMLYAYISFLAT